MRGRERRKREGNKEGREGERSEGEKQGNREKERDKRLQNLEISEYVR